MQAENIANFRPKPAPSRVFPVCPFCEATPAELIAMPTKFGPLLCAQFVCAGCHKIVSVAVIGEQQAEPTRVIIP